MQNRSCVNGILAAVLSASIVPTHAALAKEKPPAPHKTAAKKMDEQAAHRSDKQEAPKEDAAKPETGGVGAPATMTQ
ncbi:hypothetical protein F7D14_05385 [Methylocystis parvus]|uniref:Uncharacterized protein n=1 Tax=Methylocystis parvus TaxID=134 RepID=A0A6B8M3M2_9HYPH|nr:hypothetical protein F7D14_05385 [Methylocystis parvus]